MESFERKSKPTLEMMIEGEPDDRYKLEEVENLNQEVIKDTLKKQLEGKLHSIDTDLEKSQQKLANITIEIKRKEGLPQSAKNSSDLK